MICILSNQIWEIKDFNIDCFLGGIFHTLEDIAANLAVLARGRSCPEASHGGAGQPLSGWDVFLVIIIHVSTVHNIMFTVHICFPG